MMRLVVRKTIRATPERLFDAWTRPAQLKHWWGPQDVECVDAHVDLRIGGEYRIANRFPDGRVVWITGEFERIEPPNTLVYTWRVEPQTESEHVTVRFERRGGSTEVVVIHERIGDERTRDVHERGWCDCLDGLAAFGSDSASST
jgi:uncharacterized protein YndB with AHSA1/START domain